MVAFVVTSSMPAVCLAGGPWPAGKGHGFLQAGYSFTGYGLIFGSDGRSYDALGHFNDMTFQLYAETGITEKLTLRFILPFKYVSARPDAAQLKSRNLAGQGNIMLGGSYLVADSNL